MSRVWLSLVMLSVACSGSLTRQDWLARASARGDGLCWWRDARWEDRGTLRLRGSGEKFARARGLKANGEWRGAKATGVLRRAGPVVLFQGEFSGAGLSVKADVDVGAEAVFRAFEPTRLGPAGLLLAGAPLRIADARAGKVLALPTDAALAPFAPLTPAGAELPCEGLSLYAVEGPELPRTTVARAGFQEATLALLPAGQRVEAADVPEGRLVGEFVGTDRDTEVFVVQRGAHQSRVAVPRDGVVWVGWVANEQVLEPRDTLTGVVGDGALTRRPSTESPLRRCPDDLPVSVRIDGRAVEVGSLLASTTFSVEQAWGEYAVVRPQLDWLQLEPEVELLVPARAAQCASVKTAAW